MQKKHYFLVGLLLFLGVLVYFGLYKNLMMLRIIQFAENHTAEEVLESKVLTELERMKATARILIQTEGVQKLNAEQINRAFAAIHKYSPEVVNVMVFGPKGQLIHEMLNQVENCSVKDRELIELALRGKTVFSDKIYCPAVGQWVVSINIPIIEEKGKIVGVLATQVSTVRLKDTVQGIWFNYGAFPIITDSGGGVIYYPEWNEARQDTFQSTVFKPFITAGSEYIRAASPLDGSETEFSFKKIGEEGWYLGIAQPLDPIRSTLLGQAAINLAMILIICLLLFCSYMYAKLKKEKEMAAWGAKLEKLEVVGQLAAGIAHEIRNPLTSVKGFLQLMQASPDKKINRDYLEIMLEEINRIEQITNEFLSLARPTVARVSQFDLNSLLVSTYQFLQSHAFMHKVEIILNLDENLPKIRGDAGQMRQVAINLIKNAIEACGSGGKVNITTETQGSEVQVSITDNGQGIPPEILSKLGTPFLTTKETGTGLGLTVCCRIIHNMGGSIQVKTQPEEGTTFIILLPTNNQSTLN